MAREAQRRRGAERAVERTADLRRHAQRQLVAQQAAGQATAPSLFGFLLVLVVQGPPRGVLTPPALAPRGGATGLRKSNIERLDAVLVGNQHRFERPAVAGAEAHP